MIRKFEDVRAFIFDMDGTILDSMPKWRSENRCFYERRSLAVPEDIADHVDRLTSGALVERYIKDHPGEITYQEGFREYLESMARHYETDVFPKKGIERFLKILKEQGYLLCVGTATPKEMAKKALEKHGLLEYFLFVADNAEAGCDKSKAEYFQRVAQRLGVRTDECVMFEDALYAMQGAKGAGCMVFAVEESINLWDAEKMRDIHALADLYVTDFDEAAEVLFPKEC